MQPPSPSIPCGIDAIASSFGLFRCAEAANAIQQVLIQGGVSGVRVDLSMPQYGGRGTFGCIFADKGRFAGQTISTNGTHVGIEVDGRVFDNNHPAGIARADWLETMQTQFGNIAEAIAQGVVATTETRF